MHWNEETNSRKDYHTEVIFVVFFRGRIIDEKRRRFKAAFSSIYIDDCSDFLRG